MYVPQLYSVSSDQSPDSVLLFSVSWTHDHAVVVCQSSLCVSPVHQWHHRLVCAIISSISVPARQTHSRFSSFSTRSYTVYCCTTVSLSGLLLQGHTESVFFHPFRSIVLSMLPDLCIEYLNIPNF